MDIKIPHLNLDEKANLFEKTEGLTALLVSVYSQPSKKALCEEHLKELELLTSTYGVEVAAKVPCQVRNIDAATFISKGKLEELKVNLEECGADLVIIDDEIAPSQQRNLEVHFNRPVMDRTEVILGVFAQRAETKEARLQIELAKIKYVSPRLKKMWSHLSRQHGSGGGGSGGGGYTKGEGEKQIEIDRRILKNQINLLEKEIEEVKNVRETQRSAREKAGIPIFAIVGYTNAGKSTLLNALTDAGVFVEDKLFATLDTTTRKFTLPNNQDILLIDTVGFIRKLPHLLVAAFRSTLEESLKADILIHLIDASHPQAEEQKAATLEVLKELGGLEKPIITVYNKVDAIQESERVKKLIENDPKALTLSALEKLGFEKLQETMIEELSHFRKLATYRIPQEQYAVVSEMMRFGNVITQEFEENDILIKVDLPAPIAAKYRNFLL